MSSACIYLNNEIKISLFKMQYLFKDISMYTEIKMPLRPK